MTEFTPILNMAEVASAQNQKEATINTGLAILEAAFNDANPVDLSATDHALTIDEYTKWFMQRCQGHTVARNLDTPAPSGSYSAKRFFIVSNEGTGTITVRPGGSGTGTISVAAAKIVLIQSDGTTLRAVSSGVALLTDLSDVDVVTNPPTDGQVLKYNATSGKWEAGDFSASTFTALTDTPASYTGKGLQYVRVNTGETALEFVDVNVDLGFSLSDKPGPSQQVNIAIASSLKFPSGLTGSVFGVETNPTATAVFTLEKVASGTPSSIGSLSISTSGVVTPTFSSNILFSPGDFLRVTAPSSQDATLANVSMTFHTTRA